MDFRLLGPLEIRAGDGPVALAAGKQRSLVALLALEANRNVPRDRIVDALWGEHAPASSPKMVQILVSQVRRLYPDMSVLGRLGDDTRFIVSEPLRDLPGVWHEVPEGSWARVRGGDQEIHPFVPVADG